MTAQLYWLLAALMLAILQIMLTAGAKRKQDGMEWAGGSRDTPQTYTGVAARLDRAQANLFETIWIFAAALLVARVAGRDGGTNLLGAALYVCARVAYIPLYASGVKLWRTLAWGISLLGLFLTLAPLF